MENTKMAPAPAKQNDTNHRFSERDVRYFTRKTSPFYKHFFPLTYKTAVIKRNIKIKEILAKEEAYKSKDEKIKDEIYKKVHRDMKAFFSKTRIIRIFMLFEDEFYQGVAKAANEIIRNVLVEYRKPNGSAQSLANHDTLNLSYLKVER